MIIARNCKHFVFKASVDKIQVVPKQDIIADSLNLHKDKSDINKEVHYKILSSKLSN